MFWKISGTDKEGKTSVVYVQGTIHIGSKNLFPLDKAVLDAFASADLVAGELSADDMNSIQIKAVRLIQESFIKAGGKKISDSLSQEEIASLNTLLGSSMVVTSLDRAEPWVLSLSLLGKTVQETTDLSANYSVDSYFLKLASESSKEVIGLDDIQAQFDVLTFGTYEQQLKILKATIKECSDPKSIQETKAELENLYAAYLADDVAKVALISQSSNEKDISDYDDFGEEYLKVVYDRRNEDWANDIKGFLEKGGVSFIFAGCAHWVGKKSVFEYMRSQGTIE
ncbi:TraB/GumN family protein [uncultured Methanobrevibacter sp.]|uniref:TraB/GumN family protein n=1 Tax=uncultured Methanobrevibacter sp. TaxID=253161 RepID=UPI002613FF4C